MMKTNFLNKLYIKKKIQLVDASNEIKKAYFLKSDKSLISSKTLLKIGNLEDSVSMAYYSMYHVVLGLFFYCGIKCENHAAAIIILKKVFEIDNEDINYAKTERVDKQYYIDFEITKDDTNKTIELAQDFISKIKDFTSKLTNKDIKRYQDKLLLALKEKT